MLLLYILHMCNMLIAYAYCICNWKERLNMSDHGSWEGETFPIDLMMEIELRSSDCQAIVLIFRISAPEKRLFWWKSFHSKIISFLFSRLSWIQIFTALISLTVKDFLGVSKVTKWYSRLACFPLLSSHGLGLKILKNCITNVSSFFFSILI